MIALTEQTMPTMSNSITVSGSYGELEVDAITGEVIRYNDEHDGFDRWLDRIEMAKQAKAGEDGYYDIVRFDLDEWRAYCAEHHASWELTGSDILMIGFWTIDGKKVEADEDWRKQMRVPA